MNIDINAIVAHLDNYLSLTAQLSITPVEANARLAKAGLLNDSKNRPGKPLRDLLRKGLLPHAFQSGGKRSSWFIPYSSKRTPKIAAKISFGSKVVNPTRIITAVQIASADTLQLEKMLMNTESCKNACDIDHLVPHNSGLYCIRISDINKLPNPFNTILADRDHNIIYIGIASKSLNRRFLNQELRAKGHGTFFRSVGAMLGHRPPKGSLTTKANKRNYKFAPTDEQKIIQWMNDNLLVNWIDYNGDIDSFETELITKYRPLLNIAKNPAALQILSAMRNECVKIANEL